MNETIFYTLLGTLSGALGTGIGGMLSLFTKKSSNKFLSCVLDFSAGLMISVIFFDLLPNAFNNTDHLTVFLGLLIGILFMHITDSLIISNNNSYINMGFILAIGIALHNIPEGLAIGVSLDTDFSLGLSIAIAILMHDIPEGLAMSIPLKMGGMKPLKILIISIITGLATGVGGLIGVIIGKISQDIIGLSLAIASGAMLFIVIIEILPKTMRLHSDNIHCWFNIFGILLGVVLNAII